MLELGITAIKVIYRYRLRARAGNKTWRCRGCEWALVDVEVSGRAWGGGEVKAG
jgi:hypothetical protein